MKSLLSGALLTVLMAVSAHAQVGCQLGTVSGAINWDATQSCLYSATCSGACVVGVPVNLSAAGNQDIAMRIDYGPGAKVTLAKGFLGGSAPSNDPKKSDLLLCKSLPATDPLGPGPWCSILSADAVGKWGLLAHNKGAGPAKADTAPIDATGANLLVVVTSCYGANIKVSSNPANTWSYTPVSREAPSQQAVAGGASGVYEQIFYIKNPTVNTTTTASVTCNGNSSYATAQIMAWAGPSGFATSGSNQGNVASGTTVQPGSTSGDLIITGWTTGENAGGTPTIDSGFQISDSNPFKQGSNQDGAAAYLVGGAGSVNPTWTWATKGSGTAVVAAFR